MKTTVFATSFLLAVAAGWAYLDAADPELDGPAAKPALREVTIDGARLTVALDHERVKAGSSVEVTVAMAAATEAGVDVRVALLEQSGSMMSRMMPPPREVSAEVVHVGADPVVLPFTLAGVAKAADPLQTAGQATQYTIQVTSAKSTDVYDGASLPVFAYQPEAYQLTVDPPAAGAVGDRVEVAVHVKSLAKTKLTGITIGLSTTFLNVEDSPVIEVLAPGEETVVRLRGTRLEPPADAAMLVQAFGWAGYGGTAAAWLTVDRETGALVERASAPYANTYFGG